MADWRYDPAKHAYIDPAGKIVTLRQMVATRDAFVAARVAMAQALGDALAAGTITLDEFSTQFRALSAETLTALHLFGSGGAAMVEARPTLVARLAQLLERQIPYADAFIAELQDGTVTAEAAGARAGLYQGAGIEAYEQARADDFGIELPFYPADGSSECKTNDRCAWIIETRWNDELGRDVTYATWQTEHDENVCETCRQRGAEWQDRMIA